LGDGGWVPSSRIGPRTRTLFDACGAEGRSAVAVVGDQNLIGVCGAEAADAHWPPGGQIPEGVQRNVGGYIADDEVVGAAADMELRRRDLLFAQIDSVDGVRHRYGATGPEVDEQCHATDGALGRLLEQLRPDWSEWLVLVVSDHDQEDVGPQDPIDLRRLLQIDHGRSDLEVEHQGTAAQVVGPISADELTVLTGHQQVLGLDRSHHVVWGTQGQVFSEVPVSHRGDHGSPRTRDQLAVVGGGHRLVPGLASRLRSSRPRATDWARWAAEGLGLDWRPKADDAGVAHHPKEQSGPEGAHR
jgi:hypothetical protein